MQSWCITIANVKPLPPKEREKLTGFSRVSHVKNVTLLLTMETMPSEAVGLIEIQKSKVFHAVIRKRCERHLPELEKNLNSRK